MKRVLLLSAALAAACLDAIDPLDPMVGAPIAERCVNEDSDPDRDVSFMRDIAPIFRKEAGPVGCGCHLPARPSAIGFEQAGLDLTSFQSLSAGGKNSQSSIIVAGVPCDSVLWQKISPGPPFGARMPFDGPPFLDEESRRLIADWIAEGARDN